MLLGASSQQEGNTVDLRGVTDKGVVTGVEHEGALSDLVEALLDGDADLERARRRASAIMGEQKCADALTVACAFNGITRVADATGIPLDESTAAATVEMRAETAIDAFDYGNKSARLGV